MHAVVNKLYYENNYLKKNAHARISEGKRRFGYPFARLAIEFSLVLLSIGPPFDFSLKAVATRRLDIQTVWHKDLDTAFHLIPRSSALMDSGSSRRCMTML